MTYSVSLFLISFVYYATEVLSLLGNDFTGTIPTQLGNLDGLRE